MGAKLNLPEFTWLVNCSIVTDHYSFKCLEAVFFGYLQVVGEQEQAWLLTTFNAIDILMYPASTIEPTAVEPGEKIFNMTFLRWMEDVFWDSFLQIQ